MTAGALSPRGAGRRREPARDTGIHRDTAVPIFSYELSIEKKMVSVYPTVSPYPFLPLEVYPC